MTNNNNKNTNETITGAAAAAVHHRHPTTYQRQESHEKSPLLLLQLTRRFSMEEEGGGGDDESHEEGSNLQKLRKFIRSTKHSKPVQLLVGGSLVFTLILILHLWQSPTVIPIEHAVEHTLPLDDTRMLWYRTWGNKATGIPVLFVHGGPGNAVADYHNGNQRFFDAQQFWVIEVDQRGTGKSQPSVRDNWHNMKYYEAISIDQIGADFELLRKALRIQKWLVWGGSFGSTLTINYGTRYPDQCLALILRGIYLDTAAEVDAVYSRRTYEHNPKRLAEFDILYKYAADYVKSSKKDPELDPNDAERLMRVYERMIQAGDRRAIWHWHVFENNLMEEDPKNLLDPNHIDPPNYPEAQSIAFFETRLWLHGSYEEPTSNLLDRVDQLTAMPIWICQGRRDEVCPPKYAGKLRDALDDVGAQYTARFLDAGHEDTDPVMAQCLKDSLGEYIQLERKMKHQ